jgi:hypothetical protein
MVLACRDNKTTTGSPSSGNKLSNTELRIKRAEAQSQINFAKTSPAAINTLPNQAPAVGIKKSNLDPLQNCYGRPSVVVPPNGSTGGGGPKGILTKSVTPKIPKGKRVTWNLDLESDIPSRPDSPYNPEPSNYLLNNTSAGTGGGVSSGGTGASTITSALPNVDQKSPISGNSKKSPLFQSPKPARPSLTEQLSQIANRASGITADIKAKAGIADAVGEQPIFTFPAKNFTVGNLQCRSELPSLPHHRSYLTLSTSLCLCLSLSLYLSLSLSLCLSLSLSVCFPPPSQISLPCCLLSRSSGIYISSSFPIC